MDLKVFLIEVSHIPTPKLVIFMYYYLFYLCVPQSCTETAVTSARVEYTPNL